MPGAGFLGITAILGLTGNLIGGCAGFTPLDAGFNPLDAPVDGDAVTVAVAVAVTAVRVAVVVTAVTVTVAVVVTVTVAVPCAVDGRCAFIAASHASSCVMSRSSYIGFPL